MKFLLLALSMASILGVTLAPGASSGGRQSKISTASAGEGKPGAILLDGKVIMAPVVRDSIGGSAMITGHYTKRKAQSIAERIVKGIGLRWLNDPSLASTSVPN